MQNAWSSRKARNLPNGILASANQHSGPNVARGTEVLVLMAMR
jgi:hypothetical protein